MKVELHGADGYGGPLFIGTCCFHRRDALCGKKFNCQYKNEWNDENEKEVVKANLHELEVESKALASCSYEENTLWGKEVELSSLIFLFSKSQTPPKANNNINTLKYNE